MPYNTPGLPPLPPVTLSPRGYVAALDAELRANLTVPGSALPLCSWGSPGIGKSAVIHQTAKRHGYGVIELRAAQIDSVDARGLPAVETDDDGERFSVWTRPSFFPRPGCGPTLIFLDEVNRAMPSVQNALFQLLDQRRIGDYTLPGNVVVVAACNRQTDGGGVQAMPAALANRFVHVDVEADLPEFRAWASGNPLPPLPEAECPPVDPADPFSPVLVAFFAFRPQHFNAFEAKARSFPTPRSWSFVDRILKRKHQDGKVELALVAGAVGQAAAIDVTTWFRLFRSLPNMDAIIQNPTTAPVPRNDQPDVLYAVAAALAMRATPRNFANILTYLGRMPGEYAVFAVKDAINRDPSLKAAPGYADWEIAHQDDMK